MLAVLEVPTVLGAQSAFIGVIGGFIQSTVKNQAGHDTNAEFPAGELPLKNKELAKISEALGNA